MSMLELGFIIVLISMFPFGFILALIFRSFSEFLSLLPFIVVYWFFVLWYGLGCYSLFYILSFYYSGWLW